MNYKVCRCRCGCRLDTINYSGLCGFCNQGDHSEGSRMKAFLRMVTRLFRFT